MAIQWSLVIFTALTGTAGWMLACVAASEFAGKLRKAAFPASVCALVLLVVGGLASVTHLSHPERMLEALGHPTSGIFTEAALVGVTSVFVIIFLVLAKREGGEGARKGIAACAAVFGVALSFMAGYSYMMAARATWNTFLLPLGYLATAIPAGVAAYLVVAGVVKDDGELGKFPTYLLAGGVIAAVCAAAYVAVSNGPDAILLGWVLAVVVGGIGSAAFGYLVGKKPESATSMAGAALACALVGAIAYRAYMWTAMTSVNNFFSPL